MLMNYMIIVLCMLLSVAYLTLLERKMLSYVQLRKGPNKIGLLQPWADALKLFTKNVISPLLSVKSMFLFSPFLTLMLTLMMWSLKENEFSSNDYILGLVFFLCISSLSVYSMVMSGWSSNSNYASLGSYRSIAQMISYEVALAIMMLSVVCIVMSYNINNYNHYYGLLFSPLLLVWFSSLLAEVNRSPYDFAEGESELVSGYNVDYGSALFSLLFLAEYGNILFMSYLMSMLMLNSTMMSLILFMILWVRATYPRLRYDKLMMIIWKYYLPLSLGIFMVMVSLSMN